MTCARSQLAACSCSILYACGTYSQSSTLKLSVAWAYNLYMTKDYRLYIRLTDAEKQGFQMAADLSGIPLSSWVRERLRLAAIRDLEHAGQRAPFVTPVPLGGTDDRPI